MRLRGSWLVLAAVAALPAQEVLEVEATVHAASRVRLRARVSGQVTQVTVRVGDQVDERARLAQLSSPELLGELAARESRAAAADERARLLAAEERAARMRAGQARRRVAAAHEAVLLAKAQAEAQEQAVRSREELHRAGRASAAEVFEQRQRLLELQRNLRTAQLREAAEGDEVERHELAAEQSALAIAEHAHLTNALRAERDAVQALVGMLDVKSPLPKARVSEVLVGPGDWAAAGTTELFVLVDARRVALELRVPVDRAHRVRPGNVVRLRTGPGDGEVTARVDRCSGAATAPGFASVWVDLDNGDGGLVPGRVLPATVELAP